MYELIIDYGYRGKIYDALIRPLSGDYPDGCELWHNEFLGEQSFAYNSLKSAFENSNIDRANWHQIDISGLSDSDRALALAIISE